MSAVGEIDMATARGDALIAMVEAANTMPCAPGEKIEIVLPPCVTYRLTRTIEAGPSVCIRGRRRRVE